MDLIQNSKRLWLLALPMIVSNIAVPLVGIVDTAIVGHLEGAHQLAGVALGSVIITQIIWLCGFLRMSTTGFSANAKGSGERKTIQSVLSHSVFLALVIGIALWFIQAPLFQLGSWLAQPDADVSQAAETYYSWRVLAFPVSLFNLAIIGWLIGQQQHKFVMRWQIISNLLNVGLSYTLAITFELGVAGVAIATVLSEILLAILCTKSVRSMGYSILDKKIPARNEIAPFLSSNKHMLWRNLILQASLALITYSGLRLGTDVGAANSILMQFFVLIALGLDGVAYAVEALVGEAHGAKSRSRIHKWVTAGLVNSTICAVVYSFVFWIFGEQIVTILTDIDEVRSTANDYLVYMVWLPVIAHWCFLLDGVYIGLSKAKLMQQTMLFSAVFGLLPCWWFTLYMENDGIWVSFLVFLAFRGVSMGLLYQRMNREETLADT